MSLLPFRYAKDLLCRLATPQFCTLPNLLPLSPLSLLSLFLIASPGVMSVPAVNSHTASDSLLSGQRIPLLDATNYSRWRTAIVFYSGLRWHGESYPGLSRPPWCLVPLSSVPRLADLVAMLPWSFLLSLLRPMFLLTFATVMTLSSSTLSSAETLPAIFCTRIGRSLSESKCEDAEASHCFDMSMYCE